MRFTAASATISLLVLSPTAFAAQEASRSATAAAALVVSGNIPGDRFIDRRAPIELSLSRPLLPHEGEIAVMIGSLDVTDLLERAPTLVVYRPGIAPLPSGEHELVVYRNAGGRWTELQRFALKVMRRGGLTRVSLSPSATLGNTGQLAEGRSAGIPAPARPTFQDFTLNSALRSSHEALDWSVETQSNVVGTSRQEQALRFGLRGMDAPQVDLSDYRIKLRARRATLSLGHVSVGTNRYLVNSFGSRGVTIAAELGRAALSLGVLNGSAVVGWDDLIGLDQPDHRVLSATLGAEVVPRRPGAFRVDLSLLDGSLLPRTSFTQGAVVDAEQSTGAGVQVSASTPNQRLRLSGGYARSRFANPARDPQLLGDSVIRRVRPETRGARYLEVGLGVLQGTRVPVVGAASLNAAYRHERVEPLYRSVAVSTQADRQQHAFDANGNVGLLTAQLSFTRSNDNLDDVPSVLRTLNHQSTASLGLPLASIGRLRRVASFLPTLGYSAGRTHQLAAGVPSNGDFRPSDLPDQLTTSHNVNAQWQLGRLRLAYRFSVNEQDNRQRDRERADFVANSQGVTLGSALSSVADFNVDVSSDRQIAKERNETSRVERLGLSLNWRPRQATAVVAAINAARSDDASRPKGSRNDDARLELSQGLPFSGSGGSRGQVFLRYALTAAVVPTFDASGSTFGETSQRQWALSSGLSVRLF